MKYYPDLVVAMCFEPSDERLSLALRCLLAQNYPKKSIVLHLNAYGDNDPRLAQIESFIESYGDLYQDVVYVVSPSSEEDEQDSTVVGKRKGQNGLGSRRNESIRLAIESNADYYFAVDPGYFLIPSVLSTLVRLELPLVAPLLVEPTEREGVYDRGNFTDRVDENGQCDQGENFSKILNRVFVGLLQVTSVRGAYLIRREVLPKVVYGDDSERAAEMVFADHLRRQGIVPYLDNRLVYGYSTREPSLAGDDGHWQSSLAGIENRLTNWLGYRI